MDIEEDFYNLRQLNDKEFEYDVALSDRFIEEWLHQNLEEGIDFNFGEVTCGTHACTVHVIFLNKESATAFKLRWA